MSEAEDMNSITIPQLAQAYWLACEIYEERETDYVSTSERR
jgi:hypothetical protein